MEIKLPNTIEKLIDKKKQIRYFSRRQRILVFSLISIIVLVIVIAIVLFLLLGGVF